MPPQPLDSRIENLEHRVTELEQLPGRIDDVTVEVSQLRTEMRAEFSALRAAISGLATASEMRALHADVISRIAVLQEGWAPPHRGTAVTRLASP